MNFEKFINTQIEFSEDQFIRILLNDDLFIIKCFKIFENITHRCAFINMAFIEKRSMDVFPIVKTIIDYKPIYITQFIERNFVNYFIEINPVTLAYTQSHI